MTSGNIAIFHLRVPRVIVALYNATPRAISIDAVTALASDQGDEEAAAGTITWLYRNRFVTGDLHQDRAIPDAQLSTSALRLLQKKYPDAPRSTVGQHISQAIETPGSRSKCAAELLMQFLLGERS
jgi:hypothetical protein